MSPGMTLEKFDEELLFAIGSVDPDIFMLRWLRARKWDVQKARQMLIKCISWRNEFGLQGLLGDPEGQIGLPLLHHGKAHFYGKDHRNRIIAWSDLSMHTPSQYSNEAEQKNLIFNLESGRGMFIPEETEVLTLVFDLSKYSSKNQDLAYTKFLVSSLEAYYPETLGLALIVDAPGAFSFFWKLISPLLDEVVRGKIQFIKHQDLVQTIPAQYIPKAMGGISTHKFEYQNATAQERPIVRHCLLTRMAWPKQNKNGLKPAQTTSSSQRSGQQALLNFNRSVKQPSVS
jgi:hypothetical protein